MFCWHDSTDNMDYSINTRIYVSSLVTQSVTGFSDDGCRADSRVAAVITHSYHDFNGDVKKTVQGSTRIINYIL